MICDEKFSRYINFIQENVRVMWYKGNATNLINNKYYSLYTIFGLTVITTLVT